MTKQQAIKLYESKFWEKMEYREIAEFQMLEKKLCMPFEVFHKAMEKSLMRPVCTHEFGLNYKGLLNELFLKGNYYSPSMQEIVNMIPAKKIVIYTEDNNGMENN